MSPHNTVDIRVAPTVRTVIIVVTGVLYLKTRGMEARNNVEKSVTVLTERTPPNGYTKLCLSHVRASRERNEKGINRKTGVCKQLGRVISCRPGPVVERLRVARQHFGEHSS